MKKEIRILGIDDAPFDKFEEKEARIIGTVFRGGQFLDGILSTKVQIDGDDSAKKLVEMILSSKYLPQLQAVMLDGIALGGFNIIDISELHKNTGLPVIVVMRKMPDTDEMKSALCKLGMGDKIKLLERAGDIHRAENVYIQICGTTARVAKEMVRLSCTHSHIPEPIRIAHMIGSGLAYGESRGQA